MLCHAFLATSRSGFCPCPLPLLSLSPALALHWVTGQISRQSLPPVGGPCQLFQEHLLPSALCPQPQHPSHLSGSSPHPPRWLKDRPWISTAWWRGRPMPRSHGTSVGAACPPGTRYSCLEKWVGAVDGGLWAPSSPSGGVGSSQTRGQGLGICSDPGQSLTPLSLLSRYEAPTYTSSKSLQWTLENMSAGPVMVWRPPLWSQ